MAKRLKTGVGHDGRPNFAARSGEATLDVHHGPAIARGMEAQQHTHATLGRAPKAKGYNVAPHNGMHTVNRKSGEFVLGGHLASYDANPANALNGGAPSDKRLTPVQPHPSMRSRTSDSVGGSLPGVNHRNSKLDHDMLRQLGQRILQEATCAPDDKMARSDWGIGTIPDRVK